MNQSIHRDDGRAPADSVPLLAIAKADTPTGAPSEPASGEIDLDQLLTEDPVAPLVLDLESLTAIDGPESGPLSNVHLRDLIEGSGISFGTLTRAGVYTERDPKVISDLLGRRDSRIQANHVPAQVFPYYVPGESGDKPVTYRAKLAEPLKAGNQKPAKYLSRTKSAARLYLTPTARNRSLWGDARFPLVVVEGEKKALAVEDELSGKRSKSGGAYVVVGVGGVSMWGDGGKLIPDFNLFNLVERTVVIVFDADADAKDAINAQREKFAAALHLKGAKVRIATVPELKRDGKTGVDDYLVHGLGKPEALKDPTKCKSLEWIIRSASHPWATPEKVEVAEALAGLALTEHQLAKQFGDEVRDRVRYVLGEQKWYGWTKKIWAPVEGGAIRELAKAWLADQLKAALKLGDKPYIRLVSRMDAPRGVSSLLEALRTDRRFEVQADAFDAPANLLAVTNGVVDFAKGALIPFRPDLMLSKSATVDYDPTAVAEEWDTILSHLFPDHEVRAFLQRCLGASITGRGVKHFFLLVGPGDSGKTTFMSAVKGSLGTYYGEGKFASFCESRDLEPNKARSDLTRHTGKRIVGAAEVTKGKKLNLALIKAVTGGEGGRMQLRVEHGKTADHNLSFKLWLISNPEDLPRIDDDDAAWNRVVKFPLGGAVQKSSQNTDWFDQFEKGEKYVHVRKAALAWMVRGAVDFWREGLGEVPAGCKAAKAELRDEMKDFTEAWLEPEKGAVVFERGALVANCDLYKAYEASAIEEGEKPMKKRGFALALKKAGMRAGVKIEGEEAGVKAPRALDGKQSHGWRGVRLVEAPKSGLPDLDGMVDDLLS